MKKLLIIVVTLGIVALISNQTNAQVSINVNIGAQPAWIPAGYQNVNYYYLPEVQSYYNVPQRQFVYLNGNSWVRSRYLPSRYRGYDLNRGRKIIVHGINPYRSYNNHRVIYANNLNVVQRSYSNTNRIRYPRNNYRPQHVDFRGHDRRTNPNLLSKGHRERHGRY